MKEQEGNGLWRKWISYNGNLFDLLSPSAKIGFLVKEIFESTQWEVIILKKEEKELIIEDMNFTGLRSLPVDILFIAPNEILKKISEIKDSNNYNTFYQLLRRKEVLFFTLVTTSALEEKGYIDFLESIGLEFLGTCVG